MHTREKRDRGNPPLLFKNNVFIAQPSRNYTIHKTNHKMSNEYFLNPPSKQFFYNIMAFLMSIMALNTNFWSFYKMPNHICCYIQRLIILIIVPIAFISQILYLVMNHSEHNFNTLAMIYTVLPVTFVLLVKTSVARTSSYKKAMIIFMEQIHIFSFYDNNRQPHVNKILITAEKFTISSFFIFSILCAVCTSSFLVVPIIHNFQNNKSVHNITSRLEIMIHFWLPFDYEFNFVNWAIMQVVTVYCALLAVLNIILFDTINLAFFYHLIGHIKILKHVLKNDFRGKMTQAETQRKLIKVTRYYNFIRKISKNVEDAFGVNIVGIYMHNLFGGGILIYQITSAGGDTATLLSYGLMIPIYMGELIILSLVLEDIRIQADEIPELVYNLRWEKMTISNQRLVLMILFQVQPVLEIRAAFNVRTGLQPAINIIKTTFSYYVMIKSRV